jgi:hypothetical protein
MLPRAPASDDLAAHVAPPLHDHLAECIAPARRQACRDIGIQGLGRANLLRPRPLARVDRCKAIALPGKPAHDKAHAHNRPRLRADPITGPSAGRDSLRQDGAGQFHVAGPTGCASPLSRRLRSAASSLAPRMRPSLAT